MQRELDASAPMHVDLRGRTNIVRWASQCFASGTGGIFSAHHSASASSDLP